MTGWLLTAFIVSVTHAPGWNDPVISIGIPFSDYQRKDIEVTDGNHVHQIWGPWGSYGDPVRLACNVILPDGTVLSPDTMISRDVWSSYCSSCLVGTDFFGVWRENLPIWYAVNDHDGNPVVPATLFTTTPWAWWWYVAVDSDSLGRIHMSYDTPGGIWYSVIVPGPIPQEVFRDSIPDSRGYSLIDVIGDRVHVLYKNTGDDWLPRYAQYDLEGNQILGPIQLVNPAALQVDNRWSLCSDYLGNACVFERESICSNSYLTFYRIDRDTGALLVDAKVIYPEPASVDCLCPAVLQGPWEGSLHLVWTEEIPGSGYPKLIRHAVIDLNGDFIVEPYTAYDYTDEDPEDLSHLVATSNEEGDLFVSYSEEDMSIPGYWIRLGWFDHNYLGIADDSTGVTEPPLLLSSSCNPFSSAVTVTCEGEALPGQLMVYDITGRLIRSLSNREGSSFLWDGRDGSGSEAPTGTYLIQGAIDGQTTSIRVVKL